MQLLNLPVGGTVGVIPLALMPPNAFGVVGPINDYLSGGVRDAQAHVGAAHAGMIEQ